MSQEEGGGGKSLGKIEKERRNLGQIYWLENLGALDVSNSKTYKYYIWIKTFEWWISRSMIDPLFLLIPGVKTN